MGKSTKPSPNRCSLQELRSLRPEVLLNPALAKEILVKTALAKGKEVQALQVGDIYTEVQVDQLGLMTLARYMFQCARVKGIADDATEGFKRTLLEETLKLAGVKRRDKEYYSNSEVLRREMEEFARRAGVALEALTFEQMREQRIVARNAEAVDGRTYLQDARIGLDLKAARSGCEDTLREVLNRLGVRSTEVIETTQDLAYFSVNEHILFDLQAFAVAVLKANAPAYLSAKAMASVSVKCKNGETVTGRAYLYNAKSVLGLKSDTIKGMLDELKARVGIEVRELRKETPAENRSDSLKGRPSTYYTDPENTNHDLREFAKASGQSVDGLTAAHMEQVLVVCKDGRRARGMAYLTDGLVKSGLARNVQEAMGKRRPFLANLKAKFY